MTERRLVFRHTTEGLFIRAYGSELPAETRATLEALGLDLKRPTAAMDAEVFGKAFGVLREALFKGIPPATADALMGERFLDGYFSTVMGGLVKTVIKLLPVEKALERVPESLMSGANFIQARVSAVGPKQYEVWMSDYSTSPSFLLGVVRRMVELAGGKAVDARLTQERGREAVVRVRWQ